MASSTVDEVLSSIWSGLPDTYSKYVFRPMSNTPLGKQTGTAPLGSVTSITSSTTSIVTPAQTVFTRPNGESYKPRTSKINSSVIRDVDMVMTAYKNNMSVLLYGPPGTGKTALIDAVFEDLLTVPGSAETEVADFVGTWVQNTDGTFAWVDGPLLAAMEDGRPLLIDEIALIDPLVMAIVYSVMDGRGELAVTANPMRGTVKASDGFYIFGACNPHVPGAIMSDALLSRFMIHIEVETDWALIPALKIPAKIAQVARNLHHKYATGEVLAAPQIRELITFRDVEKVFGTEFALANFISQSREEDRATVTETISSVYGVQIGSLKIGGK